MARSASVALGRMGSSTIVTNDAELSKVLAYRRMHRQRIDRPAVSVQAAQDRTRGQGVAEPW